MEAGTTGVAYETVQLEDGSLPLLAIMLLFQRSIVSGLTQGSVKG